MADLEPSNKLPKTEQSQPAAPLPEPAMQPGLAAPPAASQNASKPKNRKKLGLIAAIVAVIAVLAGGSAAAYYGVIVPSKPENILKKSILNTISQKKTKFEGKLSYESTDQAASIKAVNATFSGAADTGANAFSSAFEVTASGVKLPFEIRRVDKNMYFKIGDLSSLTGLVQSVSPVYASTFATLNKKLANQWVEIDETLLKQANADCAVNANFALTKQDIDMLEKRYEQVPFSSIKSTSSDTVNGRAAAKYEIEINNNKGAEYFNGLPDLSFVKKINECGNKSPKKTLTQTADNGVTPLTLWIDKGSKQIVKLAGKSTAQDEQKSKFKANFEVTMQYGQASIAKPEGAKPLLEILGDLSQLFGLSGRSAVMPAAQPQPAATDGVSQECLKAIQDYTNSGGTKPIPTCL